MGKKSKRVTLLLPSTKTATKVITFFQPDPKGNSGYYAPDGTSMQKDFLPAPL